MRWASVSKPNIGDTRIITKFLYLPKSIEGETRWLERATWSERYNGPINGWEPVNWIGRGVK